MEVIMSQIETDSPSGAAIFYGGLIAGMLDAADGVVAMCYRCGPQPDPSSAIHC